MAKAKFDWEKISESQVRDFIKGFEDDKLKKEFVTKCVNKDKGTLYKGKTKEWLVEKFDATGEIEWVNRPVGPKKKIGAMKEMLTWFDL